MKIDISPVEEVCAVLKFLVENIRIRNINIDGDGDGALPVVQEHLQPIHPASRRVCYNNHVIAVIGGPISPDIWENSPGHFPLLVILITLGGRRGLQDIIRVVSL